MMKQWIGILLVSSTLVLTACSHHVKGSGTKETTNRAVESFNTVRVVGNYQVNITVGKPQQISITADNNLTPYIETHIKNNALYVETKKRYILEPTQVPTLDINVDNLKDVMVVGNGVVNANGIKTEGFDIKIVGMGNVTAAGTAKKVEIKMVGSGQVAANNLTAQTAEVKMVGAGNIAVFASDQLIVRVSGSGKVQYYGEPRTVDQKISGSGEVIGIPNAQKNPA